MEKHKVNSLKWGAWGGIVGCLIATGGYFAGEPLGGTLFGYGAGGFFWLWAVAEFRNWYLMRKR